MKFILRWLGIAVATFVAIWLIPGINAVGDNGYIAVAVFSLILAFVNSVIKPVAQILSLPVTIITLGFFYLIVNALLLSFASWLSLSVFSSGVQINGFLDAFFGAIVISIISGIINGITGANDDA